MRDVVMGRRRLLALAAAGLAAAGCSAWHDEDPRRARPIPEPDSGAEPIAGPDMPAIRSEFVFSACRRSSVELITAYPSGVASTQNLPMVLYLHGRDGVRPTPIPFETLAALENEYRAGAIPPFGFVSVDGGYNAYWLDGSANGDLLTMLDEELPRWLRERGLSGADGMPYACAGISTGGFGALNYAIGRTLAGAPVSSVAALAPAMLVDWEDMQDRGAFATEQEWRQADPLYRLDALGDVPLGLWVGEDDPFLPGTERLAEQHGNTPVFTVVPGGGHEPAVFEAVGTDMVRFLADGIGSSG